MEDTSSLPFDHSQRALPCTGEPPQPQSNVQPAQAVERERHIEKTMFDEQIEQLGLTGREKAWPRSKELRQWAHKHARRRFVPEKLLRVWRIRVRFDL
jgi:hypothetical protein